MNWLTSRCAPLAALAALALTSCDTGTALNVDLPDTATTNTQYQDYDVASGTVRLSPVQTQKTDHFLIGRLADNVAGTTTARAFFNVVDVSATDSLPSKFIDAKLFSGQPTLDSTVLVMGFDRVYGSSSTPARFDVSTLGTPLDDRKVYTSTSSETGLTSLVDNVSGRLDATKVQVIKAADTSVIPNIPAVTTTVPDPTLRLVLQRRVANGSSQPVMPLPFANTLFTQLLVPGFSQTQLDAKLKGLAIAPNSSYSSAIVSFGRPNLSRMILYFHSTSAWKIRKNILPADTLKRSYTVFFGPAFSSSGLSSSSDPRYYTQLTNDLPSALAALSSTSGIVPSTVLNGTSYAQEGTGFGTRVTFTGLDALTKAAAAGGLTINRAELRVPVKPYTNVLFPNPNQLYAVEVGSANEVLQRLINFQPTDRVVQSDGSNQTGADSPAAGFLTTVSATQTYYTLPITSYLQAYLNNQLGGNPTGGIVLVPSIRNSNTLTLNRAVLDAANIKLRVYYSKR
ncbi:DUF4270 domain-containing protein [Hymenobacter sp. DH14]|uniref:DUF4270 domain-containing protein n=1 Tax=Hymenobacter cyanobacteriorum TaxID=2926463 RepID=A0A9X2AH50_9BACT|nr:DUF4270 family protein [Hymenobacter cyanobacteriorum]MCI1188393.1 DUF4270 domain-containing protein [Hymenobacter cyanobacteriorum]